MEVSTEDKYQAAIVVNWLRTCSEDPAAPDRCGKCPFDDGIHNCMDYLHTTAADLLVKISGIQDRSVVPQQPQSKTPRFSGEKI